MKFTGIVLAGGKSSRMGTDKGLMEFNGKKLIEYPLALLNNYCEQLLISANSEKYSTFGFEVIYDEFPDAGPIGGLAASLKHSSNEWNLVLGCDLPNINDSLIQLLISHAGRGLGVVPIHDGMMEPLAALYNRSIYQYFERAIREGNFALHKILHESEIHFIDIKPLLGECPELLANFNSPKDVKS